MLVSSIYHIWSMLNHIRGLLEDLKGSGNDLIEMLSCNLLGRIEDSRENM
jgi:hypothetical protein